MNKLPGPTGFLDIRYASPSTLTLPPSALLTAHQSHRLFLGHRLAPAALVQATLDPLVAIGSLLPSPFSVRQTFGGPLFIFPLVVVSPTLSRTPPKRPKFTSL